MSEYRFYGWQTAEQNYHMKIFVFFHFETIDISPTA